MATVQVVNLKNEKTGSIDLPDEVFAQKVNQPLVLQVIKAQLAGMRQGTAGSKTKGLVRGGGKKPFRQKGTGNARQGSSRSPLMPGGGSNFGPKPRDYSQNTPKEMVRGAMRSVLSDKLASQRLIIVDDFNIKSAKTKEFNTILKNTFKVEKALLVDADRNTNLERSTKNIPYIRTMKTDGINTYDMVKHEWLFLSKKSAQEISKNLMKSEAK